MNINAIKNIIPQYIGDVTHNMYVSISKVMIDAITAGIMNTVVNTTHTFHKIENNFFI